MAAFVKTAIPNRYIGASADTKPTGVGVGSMCYEHDTGKTFVTYDGTNWVQYAPATYLSDVVPLTDDAEYLGTSALGWKGLYLPDTLIVDDTDVVKLRTSANDADVSLTALNLTLSGTTTALTFSGAATIVAGSGLTIPAFTLGGKLTAGAVEIEGSAFDIDGGDISAATVSGDLTWSVAQSGLTLTAPTINGTVVTTGLTLPAFTLGGAIAGGQQSWSDVGDLTFASGKGITSIGQLTFENGSATIATGAIAVTVPWTKVVVQGGTGSGADTLSTATGGSEGQILILSPAMSGANDQVTVADGTGADTFILNGGADFVMDSVDDRIMLVHNGTEWVEVSRSSGS